MKKLIFLIIIAVNLLSCASSDIRGMWISSSTINQKGDSMYLSVIYDFYSQDSLYIESLYYYDNNSPTTVHYKINGDTICFCDTLFYTYKIDNNELHLLPLEKIEEEAIYNYTKEIIFLKASAFPKSSKITDISLKGPFLFDSSILGTDSIEFVDDTTFIQRDEYGYKQAYFWKLHHKKNNIYFLEWWNDYSDMGYPFIIIPTQVSKDSFKAIMHYNKEIEINFRKIDSEIKRPSIQGVWKEDSIVRIFSERYISDTVVLKPNRVFTITEDSIYNSKSLSCSYISDYTGKELWLTQKINDKEKNENDYEYYAYKIFFHSENKLVLSTIKHSQKYVNDIIYLSKKN